MLFRKKRTPAAPEPAVVHAPSYARHRLAPPAFQSLLQGSQTIQLGSQVLRDYGKYMKAICTAFTRFQPAVSSAVWTWQHMCKTNLTMRIHGRDDETKKHVIDELNALHQRISPIKTVQQGGMDLLLELYFRSLFKFGRFAGSIVPTAQLDGIETYHLIDPFHVSFDKQYNAYVRPTPTATELRRVSPLAFYYYGLTMDQENPYGTPMLEAARTLIGIANDMLNDMRLSSANAGIPRLHIKITPPTKTDFEDDDDFRDRAQNYFTNTVKQFSNIAPDDNVYSWDDVDVKTIGGSAGPGAFVWSANRSLVDEEIISAFHLYPWIAGKSFATTKNWVRSQFDILMVQVESLQNEGERFAEWIDNTHLALRGITDTKVSYDFKMLRDPAIKDIAVANRFQISNAVMKARTGIISPDDAARELGYDKAYNPNKINTGADTPTAPSNSLDDIAEVLGETNEDIKTLLARSQGVQQ